MRVASSSLFLTLSAFVSLVVKSNAALVTGNRVGAQAVNLWRLDNAIARPKDTSHSLFVQDFDAIQHSTEKFEEFPEQYFRQPLDHFSNTSETFGQRYWINTRHYTPGAGGPVIVLDGGETSGEDRIPFLDTGIVEILARATGGVGVVLEHRYYGSSIPVSNFSTDNLRWLNNEQSAADSANFMANVKFPGIEEDLTAPNSPWIYYGGSYAGARAAHMRVLYPELVYGAIASSGVTHAQLAMWEYSEIIRKAADPTCAGHLEKSIETIDFLLGVPHLRTAIKALFGLADLEHDDDFMALLESPLGGWQGKVWDPKVGSTEFDTFCDYLNKPVIGRNHTANLPYNHEQRMIELPGGLALDLSVINYANYMKENYVSQCADDTTVEECFGTYNDSDFQDVSLDQTWRAWTFQVCTQWGYFSTAPPDPKQPRIVSRLMTLEYQSRICRQAYPPGKYFTVPEWPNITSVNALGDFTIAADRLAIIDGEVDPWRPYTPHSEYAPDRPDTLLRPFKLIPNGVHHYDEYGLRDLEDEPAEIRKIHGEMIVFVLEWLKTFKASH